MDFAALIEKHMSFVKAVREFVFPTIPADHVRVLDECPGIEFGGYNFYPVEDSIETIAGKRPVVRWNMTTWVTVSGGPWEPDDVDEKDIGQFDTLGDCLAEVGRLEYADKINAVAENIYYDDMEKAEAEYKKYRDEHHPESELCPHGKQFHECNACMIASDIAYDVARENRHFGK